MSAPLASMVVFLAASLALGGRERHSSPLWFASPHSPRSRDPHGNSTGKKLSLNVTADTLPGKNKDELALIQSNANSRRSAARGSDFADLLQAGYLEASTDPPARRAASNASTGEEMTWALAEHALAVPTDPTNSFHVGNVEAHEHVGERTHRKVCAEAMADMYQAHLTTPIMLKASVMGIPSTTSETFIFRVLDDGYSKMVLTTCNGAFIQSGFVLGDSDTWADTTTWQHYEYYIQNWQVPRSGFTQQKAHAPLQEVDHVVHSQHSGTEAQFLAQTRTSSMATLAVSPGDAGEVGPIKGFFSSDAVGPWACAILLLALAATVLSLYAARVLNLVALSFVFAAVGFLVTLSVVIYLTVVTDVMWDSLAGKETCPYCALAAAWASLQAAVALCVVVAVPHLCGSKEAPPPPPPAPTKRFPRVDFPRPLSPQSASRLPGEDLLSNTTMYEYS